MDFLTEPLIGFLTDFGGLAAVIVFVVLYMRHREGTSAKELEARTKRDAWIEGLVDLYTKQQAEYVEAQRTLVRETLVAFQGFANSIDQLSEAHEKSCKEIVAARKQLHTDHVQIYTDLDGLERGYEKLYDNITETRGEVLARLEARHSDVDRTS